MTFSNILLDLKNMIGPGVEIDDTGLKRWLNDAYMQMVDEITKVNPDFFTKTTYDSTINGTQEYDLPDDFEKMLMLNLQVEGTWRRALPLPNINVIPVHSDTASSQGFSASEPTYYLLGNYYGLMPIPGETTSNNVKLWYVYTPGELTDSDEPAFPAKYHHILKYAAYANYMDQDGEHAAAERMRIRFDGLVARMVEGISQRQVDEPKSVEVTTNQDLYVSDADVC